ncbi:hypothetical protein E5288_WYG020404 [Bos mutus]|uniref:Follitropin subunit beta n=1 Tax=Bos mutus TaxID=72004 RepID=A0A6B0RQ92_9CETA|nr:hypothetical protein [Bos mutus]
MLSLLQLVREESQRKKKIALLRRCRYPKVSQKKGLVLLNKKIRDPARPNIQKTCTFKELVYETVKVPGCAHHADSLYTYPVATECHCGKCDSDSTDCTVRGLGPSNCSFREIKE